MKGKKSLEWIRVRRIEHIVKSSNKEGTVTLTVMYKGQVPVRAHLVDGIKRLETGILLDHIQLVIFEKGLTEVEYNEIVR